MYASGVVVPATGIFLNNGMCYFSLEPGDRNQIKGGERPRFVMSPTLVFRGEKPYLATGAAGGWTIPQTILPTILNSIDLRLEIDKAAAGPRFIQHYLRNSIPYIPGHRLEPGQRDLIGSKKGAGGQRTSDH
jgi:gamma-glutamyltranspeptidase